MKKLFKESSLSAVGMMVAFFGIVVLILVKKNAPIIYDAVALGVMQLVFGAIVYKIATDSSRVELEILKKDIFGELLQIKGLKEGEDYQEALSRFTDLPEELRPTDMLGLSIMVSIFTDTYNEKRYVKINDISYGVRERDFLIISHILKHNSEQVFIDKISKSLVYNGVLIADKTTSNMLEGFDLVMCNIVFGKDQWWVKKQKVFR